MSQLNIFVIDKLTQAFYRTFGDYCKYFPDPKGIVLFCEWRYIERVLN